MRQRILAALCLILAAPALAQAPADPDWPCIQRKVGTISAGTVWSGPDLAGAGPWDKDFEAASLAQKLASRRTPMAEVDGLIEAFAQAAGPEKSLRLTRVFAGVLELTNTERDRILNGITRYARGQHKLADRIRDVSDKVGEAKDSPMTVDSPETLALQNQLQWDTRIFEERRRSLTYVCETPVLLEQRVFDIARRIQQRL